MYSLHLPYSGHNINSGVQLFIKGLMKSERILMQFEALKNLTEKSVRAFKSLVEV